MNESPNSGDIPNKDTVQIPMEDFAIMCADALAGDPDAIHSTFYQNILQERTVVTNRVVELLLNHAESVHTSITPFLEKEGYDFFKEGYKFIDTTIATANQILQQIATLREPFHERMYRILLLDMPAEIDIATERLWFLIRVRDWKNLSVEIENGTLDHSQTMQEIWDDASEYETYMDTEEFREFYEGLLIPLVVAKEDWASLIWVGFHGSRGGEQHPSVPSDVVDRSYRQGPPAHQKFLMKEFPDLAQYEPDTA